MDIKEINHIIRTRNMNRELFLVEQSKKFRASAYTKFKEETEKTRNETEGVFKLLQKIKEEEKQSRLELLEKIKEEEERSKLTKELLIDAPMHDLDLDRAQKENKELVAKLEKVEKDRKFAVQSRIELIKILDGLRKKVSCLEVKCVNLESQKKAYMERIASLEEQLKKAVEIEVDKLVDGNTDEYENNTMFGSEDDTVYVDFDQVVGNF